MFQLFAAAGTFALDKGGIILKLGQHKYRPTQGELSLWLDALWSIRCWGNGNITRKTNTQFYIYLNQLISEGFIINGTGGSRIQALYALFDGVIIYPSNLESDRENKPHCMRNHAQSSVGDDKHHKILNLLGKQPMCANDIIGYHYLPTSRMCCKPKCDSQGNQGDENKPVWIDALDVLVDLYQSKKICLETGKAKAFMRESVPQHILQ